MKVVDIELCQRTLKELKFNFLSPLSKFIFKNY